MAVDNWLRRLKAARERATHTPQQWEEMKRRYRFHCLRCKRRCDGRALRLTKDHIIPLSEGGDDAITNIQPLCPRCNVRKSTKRIDYRLRWDEQFPEYLPQGEGVMPVSIPANAAGLNPIQNVR